MFTLKVADKLERLIEVKVSHVSTGLSIRLPGEFNGQKFLFNINHGIVTLTRDEDGRSVRKNNRTHFGYLLFGRSHYKKNYGKKAKGVEAIAVYDGTSFVFAMPDHEFTSKQSKPRNANSTDDSEAQGDQTDDFKRISVLLSELGDFCKKYDAKFIETDDGFSVEVRISANKGE